MKRHFLAAALAATALAACGDSTGPEEIGPGSLAFSYSGARSGSYSASGAFTAASGGGTTISSRPFAAGVKLDDPVAGPLIAVIAFLPVTTTSGHQATFLLPAVSAAQTFTLAESCTTTTFCPLGLVSFDLSLLPGTNTFDGFVFTSGSLAITSISSGHMAGTFSGVAEDSAGIRSITVSDGTFDVPLVSESRFVSANRMGAAPAFTRLRAGPAAQR